MDFEKVLDKYPDSISEYDLKSILNDPAHGKLNFMDIQDKFLDMVDVVYQLELHDFRSFLFPEEKQNVENFRNSLLSYINQIQTFDISQPNSSEVRQNIISSIFNFHNSEYGKIYGILRQIKVDQLLSSSKAESLDDILTKATADLGKIEEIKNKLDNYVEEAKKGVEDAGVSKGEVGSLELAKFFLDQSKIHEKNSIGEDKKSGRLKERQNFFIAIASWLGINIILYLVHIIKSGSEDNFFVIFFDKNNIIEYGILSLAVLSLFYIGMSFATNNYSIEKQLEVENKHRSNIGKTLQLFLSIPQSEDSRSIVLQEGVKILFSPINGNYSNSKVQNITTPATEIINIARDVKDVAR